MKRLLLALLAALALPSAVNAESVWLVVKTTQCGWFNGITHKAGNGCGAALEKIEMESMAQCHENGEVWNSEGYSKDRPEKREDAIWHTAYKCLNGK